MADPDADDGIVLDPEIGIADLQLSPWFDYQSFESVPEYVERVTHQIVDSVESSLGISSWHRRFHPDTPLHPNYAALGGELPPLLFGVYEPPPEEPPVEPVQPDEGLIFFRPNIFGTAIACMLLSILLSIVFVLYSV